MRILFIDHSSHAAGAAVSLRYLAAGLIARGHDVHVALVWPSQELEAYYASAGLTVHALPGFPTVPHTTAGWVRFSSPRSIRGLIRLARHYRPAAAQLHALVAKVSPDIVHLNSVTLLSAAFALRKSPVRVIWHIRESPPFGGRGWRTSAIAGMMRSAVARTIFISRDDQSMWTKGAVGTVVYCCTPTPTGPRRQTAEALRAELGLAPSDRVVLFVGGFQEIKGFQVLCRAFPLVCRAIPEARLVIIGANVPPPASRLAAFARRYGRYFGIRAYHDRCQRLLEESVPSSRRVVKPLVPNVADYLDLCEFLVFPSVRPHFARPVIEAALSGKPSIASRFGGIREVVSEGDGAVLVPPGDPVALADAMIAMLGDSERTRSMGCRAREFAGQKFTVDLHVDAVEKVYAGALGGDVPGQHGGDG
ncbi:MAG: glycosyltransferase family 4 protein [Planctomycetia bacterium]